MTEKPKDAQAGFSVDPEAVRKIIEEEIGEELIEETAEKFYDRKNPELPKYLRG